MSDTQDVLTPQAIFDAVCEHMDKQRAPSMTTCRSPSGSGETCAYRGGNGRKCAVGCLISDEEYRSMGYPEHMSVEVLAQQPKYPARLMGLSMFLLQVQRAHDGATYPRGEDYMTRWKRNMQTVAGTFSLATARLDAIEV